MQRIRYYYLLELQYLGFRFHGWQKQPGLKTVERMLERSMTYVLDQTFKVLVVGRTDAMVSANRTYVELFIDKEPLDKGSFMAILNKNLPQDLRALSIRETTADFNIIQHPKVKEYLYLFSYGEKYHPFSSPFMTNIQEDLNIDLIKQGAALFKGRHDFRAYAYKARPETQTVVNILNCEVVENDFLTANFFPEHSYLLRVEAEGFKRHQIRLMMGALIELGNGSMDLDDLKATIERPENHKMTYIAPASGLILNAVRFKDEEK